jgi:PAT family beta-lactamase induction signal transducer AmpG
LIKEKKKNRPIERNPWTWIPSLYFAEGLPYVVVMIVSVIMYKRLGISNTDIALYTSWLYLPWIIKPFWSPIVEHIRTKRFWIVLMQLIVGAGLAGVALTIPVSEFFKYTLAFFWLLAFSSATHDIAADGFYMLGLTKHQQAFFVGIRSTFYRFAMITGQGLIVILAGHLETITGLPPVELYVTSVTQSDSAQNDDRNNITDDLQVNDLKILCYPDTVKIKTITVNTNEVDSLKSLIKKQNEQNGFYESELTLKVDERKREDLNWFNKSLIKPFENFIRNNFGDEKKEIQYNLKTGNIGIVYFLLSKVPDEEIILNLGRKSGDESISLIEGNRFIITKDNWNKPAFTLFQLDPKLKVESFAVFQARSGNIPFAWSIPYPTTDKSLLKEKGGKLFEEFFNTFSLFFKKKHIGIIIAFMLFYRFGEAQLVKLAAPFLLDVREVGGLGLTTGEVGFIYGTIGIMALVVGGILGGVLAARHGLKFWIYSIYVIYDLHI